jgi:hypothetical protein
MSSSETHPDGDQRTDSSDQTGSSGRTDPTAGIDPTARRSDRPREELTAQIDLLAAENRQLRERLAAAHRSQYRETALALCGVGLACGLLAVVVPTASTVLFALAGIGVFGGVLTYVLTPERFISADVGQRVYAATAASYERLCGDLGLSDRRVYVATDEPTGAGEFESWLFVPQTDSTAIPEPTDFDSAFVVTEGHRGLSLRPTGSELFSAFEDSLTEPLGTTPAELCDQLSDGLVEDFELARAVEYDTDPADGRVSVQITEALYGDGGQFDHPVVSLFAVGLAAGLSKPVEATVTTAEPLSITFRWEPAADESDDETDDNEAGDD